MKSLQEEYIKHGNIYKRVSRIGDVCIYKVSCVQTGRELGLEVFIVNKQETSTINRGGAQYLLEAKEMLPNNSNFGTTAFFYAFFDNPDDAKKRTIEKAKELSQKVYTKKEKV